MARTRKPKAEPPAGPGVFVIQHDGHGRAEGVFTDRDAAEARRRELDRAARGCSNPFDTGGPEKHSADDAARFWQALTALKLPLPKKGQEWHDWWEAVCAETTAEQRDLLWDALDNWHYFDVVEVPLED